MMSNTLTLAELKTIIKAPIANLQRNWPIIEQALNENGILNRDTALVAAATVKVETGTFAPIQELGGKDYFTKMYEWRKDLGNNQPGDGAKFCGRGFIQITGRANYLSYGNRIGVDLVSNPSAALDPANAAKILALFFKDKKIHDLSVMRDWLKIRKRINGGLNGFEEFRKICEAGTNEKNDVKLA